MVSWHLVDINTENGLEGLVAFSVFAHGAIMNGVSLTHLIVAVENLSISVDDVFGILLEQIINSNIKLFVSFDAISIVEHLARQVPILDIHVFESIFTFLFKQLIVESLFQVGSFQVENGCHTFVVAFVAHTVVGVSSIKIYVNFLMYNVLRSSHLSQQI